MTPDGLNWIVAYVGFKEQFINSEEVLSAYYNKEMSSIDDRFIVDLEINKDSPTEFLNI